MARTKHNTLKAYINHNMQLVKAVILINCFRDIPGAFHLLRVHNQISRSDLNIVIVSIWVHLHSSLQQITCFSCSIGPRKLTWRASPSTTTRHSFISTCGISKLGNKNKIDINELALLQFPVYNRIHIKYNIDS